MTERQTRAITLLLALAASGLASGCSSLSPGGRVRVDFGEPFIIARTQDANWGKLSHPIVQRVSSNRIVVRYHCVGDQPRGHRARAGADGPMYSDDGGVTWQAGDPYTWVDGPPNVQTAFRAGEVSTNHNGFFWGMAEWPDGRRTAYGLESLRSWAERVTAGTFSNELVWSADGVNWHGPRPIKVSGFPVPNWPLTEYNHKVFLGPRGIVLPDQTLIVAAYSVPINPAFRYSSLLLASTNGGASFEYRARIADSNHVVRCHPWGMEGPCEPALERLPDGELLSIMRTGMAMENAFVGRGYCLEMLEARSRDDGRTWSVRQMDDRRGVWPVLKQLSNGVLVLLYGRPGNHLAVSLDGGRTWDRTLDVTPYHVKTSGYMDMIEVSRGRILLVYDTIAMPPGSIWLWEPPAPVNTIWGVFVDLQPRGG